MTRSARPRPPHRTVAHVGAFDLASYGDQLYPIVAAAELGRRLDDVEVLPFGPVGSDGPGGAATWALGPWSEDRAAEVAARSSVVLCGGGEIVQGDGTCYTRFYDIDRRDAADLAIDRWFVEGLGTAERSCPLVWHAPGVPDELDDATAARVRAALAHRAIVAVRDDRSRRVLEAAGVERTIDVVPDSALLMDRVLEPATLDQVRDRLRRDGLLPADGPIVVVQGNNTMTPHAVELAQALDLMAPELQVVTVVVSPCHDDDLFAGELRARYGRRAWALPADATLEELAATIAGAGCFLGVSLHAAITALVYGRPWVTYDPFGQAKLAAFAELAGATDRRSSDATAVVRLAARLAGQRSAAVDPTGLQRRVDAHFDRVAELLAHGAPAAEPVTWTDTAAPVHLALRRVPRPVAPAPASRPPALRRPDLSPSPSDLATAVDRALAARRSRRTHEADEHDWVASLTEERDELRGAINHCGGVVAGHQATETELRGAIDHLEGVVAGHQATEIDLRARLAACAEARAAAEEALRRARESRIYRWTGRPRSLGVSEPTTS